MTNINNWAGDLNDGFNPPIKKYQPTSDFIYIRMHGTYDQYMGSYDKQDYQDIFNLINDKLIDTAFVFFNNTDDGTDAFDNAIELSEKFNIFNL